MGCRGCSRGECSCASRCHVFCNVVSPGSLFEAKSERERVKGKHGRWVGHCVATEGRNLHLCVSDMVLFFSLFF